MDISVPEVSPHGEPVGIDLGLEKFLSILEFVCHKRGVYFELVDPNLTSQICPRCQTVTGKKLLSERVHSCSECGYTTDRDVAVAQLIAQRGLKSVAVGRTVQRDNAVLGVSPMSDIVARQLLKGKGLRRSQCMRNLPSFMRGGVKKQLTIYDAISDTESASLMNPISEHQTQALQRFLEKGKDGSLV